MNITMNITKVVKLVAATIVLTAFAALWFAQDAKADETGVYVTCETVSIWDLAGLGDVVLTYSDNSQVALSLGTSTSMTRPLFSATGSPIEKVRSARIDAGVTVPPNCDRVTPTTTTPTSTTVVVSSTTTTSSLPSSTVPGSPTPTTVVVLAPPVVVTQSPPASVALPPAQPAIAVEREPQFTG